MELEVTTHIEADPQRVWAVLVDWERQPRWMVDARRVEIVSQRRAGVGVRLRCRTVIAAGVPVTDELVVTQWEPPRALGTRHEGWLVRGVGAIELEPTAYGTHVRWWEVVEPPLGPVGELVSPLVVPAVRAVLRRSLAGLKRLAEHASVRPSG